MREDVDVAPQLRCAVFAGMALASACRMEVTEADIDATDETSTGTGVDPDTTSAAATSETSSGPGGEDTTAGSSEADSDGTSTSSDGTSTTSTGESSGDTTTTTGEVIGTTSTGEMIGTTSTGEVVGTTSTGETVGTTTTGELPGTTSTGEILGTTTTGESESSSGESSSGESSSDGGASSDDGESSGGEDYLVEEHFDGNDGAPWPAPWTPISQAVLESDLDGGMGRMAGEMSLVGRMGLPGYDVVDVDMTIVMMFEDPSNQGIGMYARQNGTTGMEDLPHGQGYCVFAEGNGIDEIGVWREVDGIEGVIAWATIPDALLPMTPYLVRFQVEQAGPETNLRAKIWRVGELEPPDWLVEAHEAFPGLQGTSGSFAVDVYNFNGTGSIWVDDLLVTTL